MSPLDHLPTQHSTPLAVTTEASSLLQGSIRTSKNSTVSSNVWISCGKILLVIAASVTLAGATWYCYQSRATPDRLSKDNYSHNENNSFPDDFVWGVATSAYQIEGAVNENGRGRTIWDTFVQVPNAILDNSTGAVADDHYHRWKDDVALMKSLNIQAYRFSIAWSRIVPDGSGSVVNEAGIDFYDQLIDELIANGIEPWITLFHWDLPQSLQEQYGGWLDERTITAFCDYARIVFERFAKKVKRFITINEPWTYAVNGHGSGIHAPGRHSFPATEPYLVAHNFLLAHARVSKLYKSGFAGEDGLIGMSNCGDFRYPKIKSSASDREAAERAMLFQWGWFVEPLVFGRYPEAMKKRLGSRLPDFNETEKNELRGSADFLGLNYYSALLSSTPMHEASYDGYWADIHVEFSDDPRWSKNAMGWNSVPSGLTDMLLWISERYNYPSVYITENGSAEDDLVGVMAQNDEKRTLFFESHIRACAEARFQGVNLGGYFAWSLMDNFEWQFGFLRRFGICRVDFNTLERTPRGSAIWYRDTIHVNGRNVQYKRGESDKHRLLSGLPSSTSRQRALPENVIIGYGSDCDSVRKAIYDGVNIVAWSFLDVTKSGTMNSDQFIDGKVFFEQQATVSTNLNLTAIRSLIKELDYFGYADVLHFASVGGWNGAHLSEEVTAAEWYNAFKDNAGDLFDGIDWDLEGNDRMDSDMNYFALTCLDKMGEISQLAKADGLFVSIAPPQSYLNQENHLFSRFVNMTDVVDRDGWHDDFTYFGSNVYAYLLFRFVDSIDLVSIQFYESYSRAGKAVLHDGLSAADYFVRYVINLYSNNESLYVDFSNDAQLGRLGKQTVSLPLRKLALGLGNGWAGGSDQRALYIAPHELSEAWEALSALGLSPRGFMFWTITLEGINGIYLARELKRILHGTHLLDTQKE